MDSLETKTEEAETVLAARQRQPNEIVNPIVREIVKEYCRQDGPMQYLDSHSNSYRVHHKGR